MPKRKAKVKPERAWCVQADGQLLPAWTHKTKAHLAYEVKYQRDLLGGDVKIVRVELRKIKPIKRKSNAR